MTEIEKIREAADFIRSRGREVPKHAIILGSGLGCLADSLEETEKIPYGEIPNFPVSTVTCHAGVLHLGKLDGVPLLVMQGRFHYYEGYSMDEVVFPVRVMRELGIEKLLLTNAAGGVNTNYMPGDLMLISDHIKLSSESPLRGPNFDEWGPRFNDMSDAYSAKTREQVKGKAKELGIDLQEGVYAWLSGPSFETPAEIRMLRTLGADAVGMSTVPESIVANHAGIGVLGISCITNMAAGILDQAVTEEEVLETGALAAEKFAKLVRVIVGGW